LRENSFKRIFQVGFSQTLELKLRAERMLKPPVSRMGHVLLLLDDEAKVVAPLLRKRPTKAVKVPGAEPMTFRDRRELWEVGKVLDRAEVQLEVFRALLGNTVEEAQARVARLELPLEKVGAERLFGLAVAHAVLDGAPDFSPLSQEQLNVLAKAVV